MVWCTLWCSVFCSSLRWVSLYSSPASALVTSSLPPHQVVSFVLVGLNCVSLLFTAKDFLRHTEVGLASQPADTNAHTHTHAHCFPFPTLQSYRGVAVSLTAGVTQLLVLLYPLFPPVGEGEGSTQYCAWIYCVMFLSPAPSSFGPSMLLGFYSIPGLKALLPRKHSTPLATVSHRQAAFAPCPDPPNPSPHPTSPRLTAAPGQLCRVAGVWVSSAPPPQHTGPHSVQATRQLPLLPLAGQCCSASSLQLCL